ncbi:MAG: polyprenyl diphosphate synthase [Salinisphaera sp.]|jgi:undecaprenyl diphosphate synthase|nr:polyprenyl diphosphate synthase [Salinisphaera sp.]
MPLPHHVAIIMDGNGRWASRRGLPRAAGHRAGAKKVREVIECASETGVEVLTLFAFSSENWNRPSAEVRLLMDLLRRTIRREVNALHANKVRMHFVGDRSRFSAALSRDMAAAEQQTAGNNGLKLIVAVDYGGRWDIVQAARRLADDCVAGRRNPADIDESMLAEYTSLAGFRQPDLFVRTGGERRISNFLLWDLAYSELHFCDVLWPDFDAASFRDSLTWYEQRDRRFGGLPSAARG